MLIEKEVGYPRLSAFDVHPRGIPLDTLRVTN
jgi:hypothetical protein